MSEIIKWKQFEASSKMSRVMYHRG